MELTAAWSGRGGRDSRRCLPVRRCSRAWSCRNKKKKKKLSANPLISASDKKKAISQTNTDKPTHCYLTTLSSLGNLGYVCKPQNTLGQIIWWLSRIYLLVLALKIFQTCPRLASRSNYSSIYWKWAALMNTCSCYSPPKLLIFWGRIVFQDLRLLWFAAALFTVCKGKPSAYLSGC